MSRFNPFKRREKVARPGGDPAERLMSQHPEWEPRQRARSGHRSWQWIDDNGMVHVVGCGSGAHSKRDAELDAQHLARRIKRCVSGNCDHVPAQVMDSQSLEGDPGAPLIRAGEQVTLDGRPYWISEIAGGIVSLIDQQGNEEVASADRLQAVSSSKLSNILDPIRDALDSRVWDNEDSDLPKLKKHHRSWIERQIHTLLKKHGYRNPKNWLSLVFTGSLTTYQYSDDSDVDISLFIDSTVFPDWVRADMIGIMVEELDGTKLPGTPFPMQCFVVPPGISKEALYQQGLRSGYDLESEDWIVPPEKDRAQDVRATMAGEYAYALEVCDKMERLLRYEPDKAVMLWDQIKKKRRDDHRSGKGDLALSNIVYKALAHRGLFPKIEELIGHKIANQKVDTVKDKDNDWHFASDDDYKSGHRAPSNNGYNVAVYELDKLLDDVYENPQYYMHQPEFDKDSWSNIAPAKGNPEYMITVYRGTPGNTINPGDWVTPSRRYAENHGMHPDDPSQDMPVISMQVPAKHLFWDGNDMNEFGYDPSESSSGWNLASIKRSSSVPEILYHWTDASNLGDWFGPNVILPHGIYMTSEQDIENLHPDVPISDNPVRIQIDTSTLDESMFGLDNESGEGYINGEVWGVYYYAGRLTPESVVGYQRVAVPLTTGDDWDLSVVANAPSTYSKWVYDAASNRLAIGENARQEGETANHESLMRKFGLDPSSSVFGWVRSDGTTELFGRPALTRGSRPKMTQYESDYRAKQAVDAAYTGLGYPVSWVSAPFTPSHNRWDIAGFPEVVYSGESPSPGAVSAKPVVDEWAF